MSPPPPARPPRTVPAVHVSPSPADQATTHHIEMSNLVLLRFQVAPGNDDTLMMKATTPIEWSVTASFSTDTSFGIGTPSPPTEYYRDAGTIAAGDDVVIPLPRSAIDFSYHFDIFLTVVWDHDDAGAPLPTVYRIHWIAIDSMVASDFTSQNHLHTLGYANGYLFEQTEDSPSYDSSQLQYEILQFQVDAALPVEGILDAATAAELRTRAGS